MKSSSKSRALGSFPFAQVDLDRKRRRRFPEVIYAQGKTADQVVAIARVLHENGQQVLATRVSSSLFRQIRRELPWLRYFSKARIAAGPFNGHRMLHTHAPTLVVSAGTSDIPVAEEAAVTLTLMRCSVLRLYDVGVAGLHRLLKHLPLLRRASVIVVVAGMDGALPSVVGGLVARPVVAVPTSVGYGASFKGVGPLLTMLASCSPGVAVVNIDNGFGAGYLAAMIARKNR